MSEKYYVTVKLIETHVNEEQFLIDHLPEDWDEMDDWDKSVYVQDHGRWVRNDTTFQDVDQIMGVEVEDAKDVQIIMQDA
jgi:hypothetical protein